jgi:hypothetical protein
MRNRRPPAQKKHMKEVNATIKAAEKAVEKAKAQIAAAVEDALTKKEKERATREEGVWLRLEELSGSFSSKSFVKSRLSCALIVFVSLTCVFLIHGMMMQQKKRDSLSFCERAGGRTHCLML